MAGAVRILCAVRERSSLRRLIMDMDDGQTCMFDLVTSGRQVIEACRKALPGILVIDAVLPDVDGLGVIDQLKCELGACMPRVIGGARTPFSRDGFLRRGAKVVLPMPWDIDKLEAAILEEISDMNRRIDWEALDPARRHAGVLLTQMGMSEALKGYGYLCCAAALASANEARLFSVGTDIYAPIAQRHQTTNANVERLIRHAIESTMSAARAKGVYTLFGNTIDPAKGKPTNAQVIALLAQRMRVERKRMG